MNKYEEWLRFLCINYLSPETAISQFLGVPIEHYSRTIEALEALDIEFGRVRAYSYGSERGIKDAQLHAKQGHPAYFNVY